MKILDFNNHGNNNNPPPPPILAGAGLATQDKNNPNLYHFTNTQTPGQLILNMGPYAVDRLAYNPTDGDEDFSVTYVSGDPVSGETVRVSALGFQQEYDGVTSIKAEGGLGNNTITIDPKVTVPAVLYASIDPNDPNYPGWANTQPNEFNFMTNTAFRNSHNVLQAGGGDATLVGGQGVDQLVGGSGLNIIIGGDAQFNAPNTETLIGGTGLNAILAGNDGTNTLIAGPQNDLLVGGNIGLLNVDHFIAGQGADVMQGGIGANDYSWQQGDGNLTVHGGIGAQANILAANLTTAGGSFLIQHGQSSPLEIDIKFPGGQNGPQMNTIQADNVQKIAVDDQADGASYTANDLTGTGVQGILANGHEGGQAGGFPDTITVNGSQSLPNIVDISANPNASDGTIFDNQGNPVQPSFAPQTNVDVTIQGNPLAGGGNTHYIVTTSIPKTADNLTVNTGSADDNVSVESTQSANDGVSRGGDVFVNTVAGNNTINVGAGQNTVATGVGLLDRIQGNLYIDAGTGSQNQLNVDESGVVNALNGDTLALTALHGLKGQPTLYRILRYTGEDLSTHPDGGATTGGPPEKTRYPMFIQYAATGGAFGRGVKLYETRASDVLYITDTMKGAPTTIYTDGNLLNTNPKDQIIVGYNALDIYNNAKTPQNSYLDNLLGPLDVEGTDWLNSGQGDADLQVFDEATGAFAQQYQVTASTVSRAGLLPITYHYLGEPNFAGSLELYATNGPNTIFVPGTTPNITTTVYTGTGPSSTLVSDANHTLQGIQGLLDVVGTGTKDKLMLDDTKGFLNFTYLLKPMEVDVASVRVGYNHLASLMLNGSGGFDSYQVQGTVPGTQYQITGSGLGNTLMGPNAANIWNITAANQGTLGKITFSDVQNLVGGTNNDDFKFVGAVANIAGNINGGGGTADKLDYSGNGGGAIAVTLTGPSSGTATAIGGTFSNIESLVGSTNAANKLTGANSLNNWSITGPNAGKVNTFSYTGIENLVGGTKVDVFKFAAAGTELSIDGGGGGDWLDYSGFASAVAVDLVAESATDVNGGLAGSVKNIQNVHGGNAGNTLHGNSQGNILIGGLGGGAITGGTGPSLLIADKGSASITGGSSAGDILIGDYTTFDTMTTAHEAALASILAEWQSKDSYADRFNDINKGAAYLPGKHLNGTNVLKWGTTVKDDPLPDAAITVKAASASGLDWFFVDSNDIPVNFVNGDHKDNT